MPNRIGTVTYLPHKIFSSEQGQLLWDEYINCPIVESRP